MSQVKLPKRGVSPNTPAANTGSLFYGLLNGVYCLQFIDESGNVVCLGNPTNKSYRLVKVTVITNTATTSYTPTSGVTALFVECWGAGGQGGQAVNAATNGAAAGGGSSGAYAASFLTANIGGAHSITIGSVSGGSSDTTFKDNTAAIVVKAQVGNSPASDTVAAGPRVGGVGGVPFAGGNVGDITSVGQPGRAGVVLSATQVLSGMGGGTIWGLGGASIKNATSVGNSPPAGAYGAGGSGGAIISGGATSNGGNGMSGLMRVWELA